MRRTGCASGWLCALLLAVPAGARSQALTADHAVQLALRSNTRVLGARAGVLEAKSSLYGAGTGILPRISASLSRGASVIENRPVTSGSVIGGQVVLTQGSTDVTSYSTTPELGGTWPILNLSALSSFSSARHGVRAALETQSATRADVALETRRQFYEVVRAVRLAEVATGALRLARDDERRVRALFEVGSVSRSDLLKAQVRTAQNQLDSLTAYEAVIVQRIGLATLIGVPESQMPAVDTLLTAEPRDYDETTLLAEASRSRPDLKAAEAELRSARSSRTSARLLRVPYVSVSGSVVFNPEFSQLSKTSTVDSVGTPILIESPFTSKDDREWRGEVALNWDLFDGLSTESRNAAAQARVVRAQATRDELRRNLEGEVHQNLLAYREALEREAVGRRAVESATENLKLTQEKYNVGSATILELIDAQVQLQRAQSDQVSALAAIRVAEAQIDRVRGRAE